MGLEQAGVGVAAGVFNTIPYFGPVIVAAGDRGRRASCSSAPWQWPLYVSGVSLVITSLEGWLLTPWLTSRDGAHQRGCDLRRPDLLELRLGHLGNAAGRPDAGRR